MRLFARAKNCLSCCLIYGDSLVDDDVDPLEVLENSNHIKASAPVSVENGRVHTFRQHRCDVFVNNHFIVVVQASLSSDN